MDSDFVNRVAEARDKFIKSTNLEGLTLKFVNSEVIHQQMSQHYTEVFGQSSTNYQYDPEERERSRLLQNNYWQLHGDNILLLDINDQYVGHFTGESEDFATYYLRNAGIISTYRNRHIASHFIQAFLIYLNDLGYSRVTSQHHGNNRPVLILMLKAGFNIAGIEVREEWGSLVKMVYFLKKEREAVFNNVIKGLRSNP